MVRVGLIGCGNITLNAHLPAMQSVDGLEIVGAADPTAERLESVRVAAGLDESQVTADWRVLIERSDIDAVVVATPQRYRPEIAIAAAESGKHLLCEKPLALSPAAARAMVEAANAAGVVLATVHNYVTMPVYQDLKAAATDGAIGDLEVATLNFLGVEDRPGTAVYNPRWRHFTAEAGGGVLMDMLHAVYLAGWLLDGEPVAVSATVDKRFPDDGDVEDLALVRFRYENGRHAMINMAWGKGPGGVELTATNGRAILVNHQFGTHPFVQPERILVYTDQGEREVSPGSPLRHGLAGIAANFHDAIVNGAAPIADGIAGERVLGAVVGAYASAATGREIALPLQPGDPVFEEGASGIGRLDIPADSPVLRAGLFGVNRART